MRFFMTGKWGQEDLKEEQPRNTLKTRKEDQKICPGSVYSVYSVVEIIFGVFFVGCCLRQGDLLLGLEVFYEVDDLGVGEGW